MTERDAISFLLTRFPELGKRIDDPEDLVASPHYVYAMLANEVLENRSDESLLNAVSRFIDELANSGNGLLEELLVVDVLEGLAEDATLARIIKAKVGPEAAAFLDRVEREYFGRAPSG